MWQESGPERESRSNKCMSDLVWLGEQDNRGEDFGSTSRPAAAAAAAVAPAVGGATNNGSKRFTHVFSREWAVPEEMLPSPPRTPGTLTAGATGNRVVVLTPATGGTDTGAGDADARSCSGASSRARAKPKGVKPLTDLSLSVGDMVCISAQGVGAVPGRRRRGLDDVRLLTGNIAAVFDDRVEVSSDRRMRVPRRGGRRGGCGNGGGAGEALDIEDLLGGGQGPFADERVLFRIDKDEWAAGIK